MIRSPLGKRAVIAVLTALACLVLPSPASADSPMTMQEVATAFSLAMARGDSATALSFVKGATPAQERPVRTSIEAAANNPTGVWSHVTGAGCRGVICGGRPWYADPPTSLFMRQEAGRWWVGGIVWSESIGSLLHLVGSDRIFDSYTGLPATAGPPQGTTYWTARSGRERMVVQMVRKGTAIITRAYIPWPGMTSAHYFLCGKVQVKADGSVSGFMDTLTNIDGEFWPSTHNVSGQLYVAQRRLQTNEYFQGIVWGGSSYGANGLLLSRTTREAINQSIWTKLPKSCSDAGLGP